MNQSIELELMVKVVFSLNLAPSEFFSFSQLSRTSCCFIYCGLRFGRAISIAADRFSHWLGFKNSWTLGAKKGTQRVNRRFPVKLDSYPY